MPISHCSSAQPAVFSPVREVTGFDRIAAHCAIAFCQERTQNQLKRTLYSFTSGEVFLRAHLFKFDEQHFQVLRNVCHFRKPHRDR